MMVDTKSVFNNVMKGEYMVKSVEKESEVWSNFWIVSVWMNGRM